MRLFVFGYGYSSAAAVRRLRPRLTWIGGTTRSEDKARAMRAEGIEPFRFDGTRPGEGIRDALAMSDAVLVSVAPQDRDGEDPVRAHHGADLALARRIRAIAYFSTVGVYGDRGGVWVDETAACRPASPRSVARLAAEARWQRHGEESGAAVSILRLSGIYGPGRNAFCNLAAGTARRLVKPGQVFNRIHVEDIAAAVDLVFSRRAEGIFNITDDEPAPPQDVVAHAAGLMGVEAPPEQDFETAELSAMARSFYGENKRVANRKSKARLGLVYAYPNYRDALAKMWAEESWR